MDSFHQKKFQATTAFIKRALQAFGIPRKKVFINVTNIFLAILQTQLGGM
jgi:hypothetical protein